jgi:hypothetical protein
MSSYTEISDKSSIGQSLNSAYKQLGKNKVHKINVKGGRVGKKSKKYKSLIFNLCVHNIDGDKIDKKSKKKISNLKWSRMCI